MRDANRFILTITASIAGFAVLIMLCSALLPIWALKHFALTRNAAPPRSFLLPGLSSSWGAMHLPLFTGSAGQLPSSVESKIVKLPAPEQAASPTPSLAANLDGAVEHLERRLQALEQRAAQKVAAGAPTAKPAAGCGKTEPSGAKFSRAPQVAIRLGEGEAISFLPRDAPAGRFHSLRGALVKVKRFFALAKLPKVH